MYIIFYWYYSTYFTNIYMLKQMNLLTNQVRIIILLIMDFCEIITWKSVRQKLNRCVHTQLNLELHLIFYPHFQYRLQVNKLS